MSQMNRPFHYGRGRGTTVISSHSSRYNSSESMAEKYYKGGGRSNNLSDSRFSHGAQLSHQPQSKQYYNSKSQPNNNRFGSEKRSFNDYNNYQDQNSSSNRRSPDRKRFRNDDQSRNSVYHSNMNRNSSPPSSSMSGSGNYYGRNNSFNSPNNYYNTHHNSGSNSSGSGGGNYRGIGRGGSRGRGLAIGSSSSSSYRNVSHRPPMSSPPPIRDHYSKSTPDNRNSRSHLRISENDARNSIRPPTGHSQIGAVRSSQSDRKFSYASSNFNRDTQLIRRRRIPVAFSSGTSRVLVKNTSRLTRPQTKNSVRDYRSNDDRRVSKTSHRSKRSKSSWDTSSDEMDKNERSTSKRSRSERTRDKSTAKSETKRGNTADGSRAGSTTKDATRASSSRPSEDRSCTNKSERSDQKNDDGVNTSRSGDKEPALKYECVHCLYKSNSSSEYDDHLNGMTHVSELRRIAKKQRAQLMKMRLDQRVEQRRIERNPKNLSKHTLFCPLCKLNFRQAKTTHQFSQAHRAMKKFLMPYCLPCNVSFRSPLTYESHICSISHIIKARKKSSSSEKPSSTNNNSLGNESSGSIPIPDLENCMTIDSTGEIDETAEITENTEINNDTENGADNADNNAIDTTRVETKEKAEIIVGKEHIKIVTVLHCEICQRYVPLENKTEQDMIRLHCSSRQHMNSYAIVKDDKSLKEKTEKVQYDSENGNKSQDANDGKEVVENEDKDDTKECDPSEEMKNADCAKNASEDELIVVNNIEINATSNDEGLEDIPDYEE